MSEEIGELFEQPGEVVCEWRIPDFLSLPEEVGKSYCSPKFLFYDSCWCLQVYPNGENAEGCIGMYLRRLDCGYPKTAVFSFGIKNANEEEETFLKEGQATFTQKNPTWGQNSFLVKRDLLKRKSELASSDILVITCTMKKKSKDLVESSLFGRLWNLSLRFKKLLSARGGTDVVLKLMDGEALAHKAILKTRSAVFDRMFGTDMRESQTGKVVVEDACQDTIGVVLSFVYSGDPSGLNPGNACEVYTLAHRYELHELTKLCSEFMGECLSVNTICDVFAVADLYQEEELKEKARAYFTENKAEIFSTEKWKVLKRENPSIGLEVLECVFGAKE